MAESVQRALAAGRAGGGIEQAHALAALKAKLFGHTVPPSLARYELRTEIGRGAASVVYAAFDPELHREVAIKLAQTQAYAGVPDSHHESRLLAEARAMAKVSHPNVVAVHDVGLHRLEDGPATLFVVMEWVRGEDLSQWRRRRHSWSEVADVFVAAGHGLAAAHRAGVIHRDFKPANVLVGDDALVRVADFGLAKLTNDAPAPPRADQVAAAGPRPSHADSSAEAPPDLTATGSLVGTPLYMAPEQHQGDDADARSDQFAYCASLYEALIDAPPFCGETIEALAHDKRDGRLAPVPSGRHIPRWLLRLVRRGLAPDPTRRFADMNGLLHALQRGRRRRRKLTVAALVVGTAAVTAAVTVPARRNEACAGFDDGLTQAWDAATQQRIAAAFLDSDVSYAAEATDKVTARLNRYAAQWHAARARVCEADNPGPEALSRGILCLERRRKALAALTSVLVDATASTVARAPAAAAALVSPRCASDGDGAVRSAPPPIDADVDRALLLVAAQADTGRYDEARAGVEAIAAASSEPAVAARAHYLRAELAGYANDFELAHDAYHRALWASERAGDEVTATRSLVRLVLVVGNHLRRFEDSDRLAEHARARLDRLALGPRDRADLEHFVGLVRYAQGDNEAALARYQAALEIRVGQLAEDHPDIAETHLSIGAAYVAMERFEDARTAEERALATSREVFGSRHPLVGHAHGNLGVVAERLGDLEDAAAHHRTALQIHEQVVDAPHVWLGRSELNLGRTLGRLGEFTEAAIHLERSVSMHDALGNPVRLAESQFALAEVLWRSDRARARRLAERALAPLAKDPGSESSAREVRRWLHEHPA